MMRRLLLSCFACLMLLALVACGGGGGAQQPAGSTKVTMTDYKFAPADLNVKPGKAAFFLVNSGGVGHDMVVIASDGKTVARSELVQPGNTSLLTIDNLTAGTYRIVCDQPGHENLGMKGTLTAA